MARRAAEGWISSLVLLALCAAAVFVVPPGSASGLTAAALVGGYGPVWSPDGTQIAFIGPARKWVVSPKTDALTETAGTNRIIVVSARGTMPPHVVWGSAPGGEILEEVRWAAGGWFVYQDSNYTLWATSGGHGASATKRLATLGVSGGDSFTLSPDGRMVAFTAPCNCGIAQGTEVGIVSAFAGNERILPHPANAIDSSPSFSPDGKRVVFLRALFGNTSSRSPSNESLMIEPIAGRPARSLHINGNWPVFSPDGRWIAFQPMPPAQPGALDVMPATGGKPRTLIPKPTGTVVGPYAWSRDSTRLVFEDGTHIGTVDLRGRKTIFAIPGLRVGLGTPQWSPDGSSIAFTAIRKGSDLDSRVYLVNADGTGLRRTG